MSIPLKENTYYELRARDPSFQSLVRVSDSSNFIDVSDIYVKNSERNDFENPLKLFNHNVGYLTDGKYINMKNFFTETFEIQQGATTNIKGLETDYFKFKTNIVLNINKNNKNYKKTIISKENKENLFKIISKNEDGEIIYEYENKEIVSRKYTSDPLSRLDKLLNYEFNSLFFYLNGLKIPDDEIYVYPDTSWTDVFIPKKYLGNIESKDFETIVDINIDFRKAKNEDFYVHLRGFTGSNITIDLSDDKYLYERFKKYKVTNDNLVIFKDKKIIRPLSVNYIDNEKNKEINIIFNESFVDNELEIYILNDVVYRYNKPEESLLDRNKTSIHFFINDNYIVDTLTGPITKNSISFFYDGLRINDKNIVQTSRFSYKIDVKKQDFDENLIDFFVEDQNVIIDESTFNLYSDDYYLLNMLGVKRCVDKMKGNLSYSIFDNPKYSISFFETLSNLGKLFDIREVEKYYNNIDNTFKDQRDRVKKLISDKPSLTRDLFKQFKHPSKILITYGNESDFTISSVDKITDRSRQIYYKIYVNKMLIETNMYSVKPVKDVDIITIKKDILNPFKYDESGEKIKGSGKNVIEIFQYDITYYERTIKKLTVDDTFTEKTNEDGTKTYTKTFNYITDLPFGEDFLNEDIVAVEEIKQEWFSEDNPEYFYVYPDENKCGFRTTKTFKAIKNVINKTLTISVTFHEYEFTKHTFFILCKNYNITHSFTYRNPDNSYMEENDLVFPIYSSYVEYETNEHGEEVVKNIIPYFPYINSSEPLITRNGKELIYGKDYTYITPETSEVAMCSYIIMKNQSKDGDSIVIQFNSAKTNILVLGYNDLNIDNKYGLIYFSELKYPVDTEYMNIFINGEKLSKIDVDILSDKLIRVKNIFRPIKTVLITTNLDYKESELDDFISLYKETKFEKLLEEIFYNCDPSKIKNMDKPDIDTVYKWNPDSDTNKGFDINVDSVQQAENPLSEDKEEEFTSDTLSVLYLNWLVHSLKTRALMLGGKDINPIVLKYFSIYNNVIIDNRIDIAYDGGKIYDGLMCDIVVNEIFKEENNKKVLVYLGADPTLKRQKFFEKLKEISENNKNTGKDVIISKYNNEDNIVSLTDEILKDPFSNILYPDDFPLDPDRNGITWTGTEEDVIL